VKCQLLPTGQYTHPTVSAVAPLFALPNEGTSRTAVGRLAFLSKHPMGMARSKHPQLELFIGTSGYSYPDWKGIVYPRSLKREVGACWADYLHRSNFVDERPPQ
jgi:hypothetical protein